MRWRAYCSSSSSIAPTASSPTTHTTATEGSDVSPAVPDSSPLVCLASESPRRRELLAQLGVPHLVQPADLDESRSANEPAADYVVRVARAKALAVRARRAAAGAGGRYRGGARGCG